MNELIISIDKGAETLNCSVKYGKAQLRTDKWPGKKLAGRWAFAESDINSIIEMGSNKAPQLTITSPRSWPRHHPSAKNSGSSWLS